MDETQISITIRPIHIERIAYWAIILALAVLVVILWTRDCQADTTTSESSSGAVAQNNNQNAEANAPIVEEVATCVDNKKNQDETDVDCGGSCGSCVAGKKCSANSDCASNICTAGTCTNTPPAAEQTLSGKVNFDLKSVEVQKAPTNNARKVVRIDYTIDNGLDEDLGQITIKVFVKSAKTSSYCLNQQPDPGSDCNKPYAEILVRGPNSGKSATESQSIEGKYLITDPSYYDPDNTNLDNFLVSVYVYDAGGNEIDGKTITDTYQVNT